MRYLDSSSLVALYFFEGKSEELTVHLRKRQTPIALTWLHEAEFTNGMNLKVFRKEARPDDIAASVDAFRADMESGVLRLSTLSWPEVFCATRRLSSIHSRTLGTRTLDLIHVASAAALRVSEFVTGDERQAKAATKEGLSVKLI